MISANGIIFRANELDINGEIPAPYLNDDDDYRQELKKQ